MNPDDAKRGVQWAADMLTLSHEPALEELFPRGVPEWIGSHDPQDFMPHAQHDGS